jgi:hypothetical protein
MSGPPPLHNETTPALPMARDKTLVHILHSSFCILPFALYLSQ